MAEHHDHPHDASHDADSHDGGSHHVVFDSPEMAAFAELEGEVLLGFVTEACARLVDLRAGVDGEVRRVLDVGSGPGVGTCELARRFASARVVAADGSAIMLEHVTARAERLGLARRVDVRRVDLGGGLAELGPADLVWASMVLHHVGDEVTALRQLRELLRPGGLLALVEHAGPVRVLLADADLGRPGLWERLDAAWAVWFAAMRADIPGATESGAYPMMLEAAGFDVVADEVLTLDVEGPLDARTRDFTRRQLQRTQSQLADHADPADLAALGRLIDPGNGDLVPGLDRAVVRATRHLYVARPRPRP